MPSVEILAVGTELLLGQLADTNSAHIARRLADAGIDVYATHTVGDNRVRIASAVRAALERAAGLITTGGLGPTVDDLTKEAVCDALGLDLEFHETSLHAMEAILARFGRTMPENNRKQALLPKGSIVLENPNGTAPGFIAFDAAGKFVASMPGVPREMKPMLDERVLPWVRTRLGAEHAIHTRVLHTCGIGESHIDERIGDLFRALENPKIAVLAHDFRCDVKVMAKAASARDAQAMIEPVERELRARLHGHVYGAGDQTLPSVIHDLLRGSSRTIAVAESCTGGSLCAELTSVAGSSQSFVGGIVAYANALKMEFAGVAASTLDRFGAVSEESVREMAQGVRERLRAHVGIAVTGIAGPSGGTPEKPVGTVWFAIASDDGVHATRFTFPGDRTSVQRRATVAALGLLWKHLAAE